MIDTTREHLILPREVPKYLPKSAGKKVSLATVYRWFQVGIAGVRLERVYIGPTAYSSKEALTRFFQRITEAKSGDRAYKPTKGERHNSDAIDRELEAAGL
jgi:Protein of unknown function (DUF1580)